MKENAMEENTKTEQHLNDLNEEQLQEVTGACAECVTDLTHVVSHQNFARTNTDLSEAATHSAAINTATQHLKLADIQARKAQILMDRVAARGHLQYIPPSLPPRIKWNDCWERHLFPSPIPLAQ
jgi:hypothetical protein